LNVKSLEEIRWLAAEKREREKKYIYKKPLQLSAQPKNQSLSLSLSSFAAGNFV
jgi:hypothetical protein